MTGEDGRRVEEALDALDDVFYVYDEHARLQHWNSALGELFGLSDEELRDMSATDFFVPADRGDIAAAVGEALETGTTVVEARAETTKGTILFELTGRRLTDADGNVTGLCGIGRDVTEHREREWQLARQNDRLAEFAEILAHDLRNPLQVATTHLELERAADDSESLASIQSALERIDGIITDVRTIALDGQAVMEKAPVRLDEVAREAWATVETMDATLDVRTEATVRADQERLQRLLENVFRNSVEHAGPGVTVTVCDTPTGFAIEDDGPGIPAENRERVFEPGFSTATTGTGFGLHVVQMLAEAHGWSVAVSEVDGGGVCLTLDVEPISETAVGLERAVDGGRGE